MGTLTDLAMKSGATGTAPTVPGRGTVVGTPDPNATMSPYEAAILRAQQLGIAMPTGTGAAMNVLDTLNGGAMPASGGRIGTSQPGTGAAMATANTLGFGSAMPAGPTQQAAPPPGSNTAASLGNASAAYMAPKQTINNTGAAPGQAVPAPGGNAQQMSPQAQAMLQEVMRQRAYSAAQQQAQQMVNQRGVFAGQQQAAAPAPVPPMPPVPQRRGPPVGPTVPIPFGPR